MQVPKIINFLLNIRIKVWAGGCSGPEIGLSESINTYANWKGCLVLKRIELINFPSNYSCVSP